jgi:hypothetical protein
VRRPSDPLTEFHQQLAGLLGAPVVDDQDFEGALRRLPPPDHMAVAAANPASLVGHAAPPHDRVWFDSQTGRPTAGSPTDVNELRPDRAVTRPCTALSARSRRRACNCDDPLMWLVERLVLAGGSQRQAI